MTSNKKKGASKELLAKKMLEKDGWIVIFKSMTVKCGPFWRGNDVADLFDIIAIRIQPIESDLGGAVCPEWLLLSVKTYPNATLAHRTLISDFKSKYELPNMEFGVWEWNKPKYHGSGKNKAWDSGHFNRYRL